ncbi:hypothetical protein AKJ09_01522 [Labilithrix luteola]|uniref:Tryptophan synthase alpha chain n=1 Tax=Labilithrix luteola TaxID=1391654 RepID=A0A0K1PMV1_9BACT|nr:hypothetical protein [Labilithrix luteola]AKU94858.1 hypothetical protein AKJ09_01522 [Labilithrix luteola]
MIGRVGKTLFWLALVSGVAFACAAPIADDVVVGTTPDASAPQQTFTPPPAEDGGEAGITPPVKAEMCIATTCPAPYASCGDGPACQTNLSNDSKNCGACGAACPTSFPYLNMISTCIAGACQPQCKKETSWAGDKQFADCNAQIEDGCEIDIFHDPNNCGKCGNACAPGVRCFGGKCGCDPGFVDCNGTCVDIQNDNANCGACDNLCAPPADAGAPHANMEWGCVKGVCGKERCQQYPWSVWIDCNGDLSDGCEVSLKGGPRDPNNCGQCGRKCSPGQICDDRTGDGVPECMCEPTETMCGSPQEYNLACADLLTSPDHCGACFHACQTWAEHTKATCTKGLCDVECEDGWADCDGEPGNGCETNILHSGANCGACGNRCDTQAGQPCIEGKCAMTECDGGKEPQ